MAYNSSEASDEDVRQAVEEMELREYGEVRGPDKSESLAEELPDTGSGEATDAEVRAAVEKMESEEGEVDEGDDKAENSMFSFSDV